jgi:hypothetical protein
VSLSLRKYDGDECKLGARFQYMTTVSFGLLAAQPASMLRMQYWKMLKQLLYYVARLDPEPRIKFVVDKPSNVIKTVPGHLDTLYMP